MTNEMHFHADPDLPVSGAPSDPDSCGCGGGGCGCHDSEEAQFQAMLRQQSPRDAAAYKESGLDRRTFLKIAGASLALAGLQVSGCSTVEQPPEKIIPYVRMPEELVPGNPVFFASTMTLGGYATGLLIETHEGRPSRVEGNPEHPASVGGSNPRLLGSILELYNPERSTLVRQANELSTWDAYLAELEPVLAAAAENGGERMRVLTETVTSPTLAAQLTALLEAFPSTRWYQYEPVNEDNVVAGSEAAFGEVVNTVYDFSSASIVLSLDADFLSSMPGSLRFARDFANLRRAGATEDGSTPTMSRLYVVESTPTITGASADQRQALRPSEVEAFAQAVAAAVGVAGVDTPAEIPGSNVWFDALIADLQAADGQSVVVAGAEQSPAVHALAHAINAALGNVGSTVNYTQSVVANPVNQVSEIRELTEEIQAGAVDTLFILGGNPAVTAPVDVPFAAALTEVRFSTHLSLYNDETSELCAWHVPQTHYIEEWSDARAFDGAASITQPPIGPLYDTVRSAHQMVALISGDERAAYDIVRATWEADAPGDFEDFWTESLHRGVIADSAFEPVSPALSLNLPEAASTSGLEISFRPDPYLWDGRYANNSWLQELPQPLTNISWDGAAFVSATTASELGISSEELIDLSVGGNTLRVAAWVMPGQPDGSVTVFLGYGRGLSADIEAGQSFNAYTLRAADAPWFVSGVDVSGTGETYQLVTARSNQVEDYTAIREGTLATFINDPDFAYEAKKEADLLRDPVYPYDENAWGMVIDLTSCIGCQACVIGCQTENNIPIVGKDAVGNGREMYWMRVDRYYHDGDAGDERVDFQPVPCMHCENAPCEQVCPVQATVHSHEGLNMMVYNRCVGTRYCSANCPYGVRRFNYMDYVDDDPILEEVRNPNVSVRVEGVMEKCTFCVQRINRVRAAAKIDDRPIADGEIVPACVSACPTNAITFGDVSRADSQVSLLKEQPINYDLLGELNTKPRTSYLARLYNPSDALTEASGAGSSEEAEA